MSFDRVFERRLEKLEKEFNTRAKEIVYSVNLPYYIYKNKEVTSYYIFTYIAHYEKQYIDLLVNGYDLDEVFTRIHGGYKEALDAVIEFASSIDIPSKLIYIHTFVISLQKYSNNILFGRTRYSTTIGQGLAVLYDTKRIRITRTNILSIIPQLVEQFNKTKTLIEEIKEFERVLLSSEEEEE